jgi:hypothetical protein
VQIRLIDIARLCHHNLPLAAAGAAMLSLIATSRLERERCVEARDPFQIVREVAQIFDNDVDHVAFALDPGEAAIPGFELSDEDSATVDLFNRLAETVDAIPIELLRSSEELRATNPRNYQKILESFIPYVGTQYQPKDAAEFLEKLNGYVRLYATNPELFKSGAASP